MLRRKHSEEILKVAFPTLQARKINLLATFSNSLSGGRFEVTQPGCGSCLG